jgi:hypothetical protein
MCNRLILNILLVFMPVFCLYSCTNKKNKQKETAILEKYGEDASAEYEKETAILEKYDEDVCAEYEKYIAEKETAIMEKYDVFAEYEKQIAEFADILKTKDIALAENWLVQMIQPDTVSMDNHNIVSIFLHDLLETNLATMNYSFEKLKGKGYLDIVESTDGNVKIYGWNDGTGNYNGGFHHVVQYKSNTGKVICIDFSKAYYHECEDEENHDEFRGFELYTMQLNNKTYYLIEVGHLQSAGWLGYRDISIYTIEDAKLIKQTLFKTSKELLSEIGYEYDAANYWFEIAEQKEKEGSFDWHFMYDNDKKIIYVPLVDNDISYGRVTDRFLLYQWDGKYFTLKQ